MAESHLKLTHPDKKLSRVCYQYIELIYELVNTEKVTRRKAVLMKYFQKIAGKKLKNKPFELCGDLQVVGGIYSSACYIKDAWPSILYLACKYADSTLLALQKNTELGGDNVHRGSVLALIMTSVNGQSLQGLFEQLLLKKEINHSLNQCFDVS